MLVLLICFFVALVKCDPYALTQANRDSLLSLHNQVRANYAMPALVWDATLETSAKTWGDNCVWNHSTTANGENLSRRSYGPVGSLAAPYTTMREYFIGWFDEEANYACSTNLCKSGAVCGHFTQLIWKTTTKVGCSISLCPNMVAKMDSGFLVCQYSGPGNYDKQHPLNAPQSTYASCPVAAYGRTTSPTEPKTPVTPTVPTPTAPLGTANPVSPTPVSPTPVTKAPTPITPTPVTPTTTGTTCTCKAVVNYPCLSTPYSTTKGWFCKIDSSSMGYGLQNYGSGSCVSPTLSGCTAGKQETKTCLANTVKQYFGTPDYYCYWSNSDQYVYPVTNIGSNGCTGSAVTTESIADKFSALTLPEKIGIGVGGGLFVIIVIVIIIVVVKKSNNDSDEQGLETY